MEDKLVDLFRKSKFVITFARNQQFHISSFGVFFRLKRSFTLTNVNYKVFEFIPCNDATTALGFIIGGF